MEMRLSFLATTVRQTSLAVTSAARLTTPSKSASTQAKATGRK